MSKILGESLDSANKLNHLTARGGFHATALQVASYKGHEKAVEMLLNWGANIDAGIYPESNALQCAPLGGYERVVQVLLERGANINAFGGLHGTALQCASLRGHDKVVQLLLDKGTNANLQARETDSALARELFRKHNKVTKLLHKRGARLGSGGGSYDLAPSSAPPVGELRERARARYDHCTQGAMPAGLPADLDRPRMNGLTCGRPKRLRAINLQD